MRGEVLKIYLQNMATMKKHGEFCHMMETKRTTLGLVRGQLDRVDPTDSIAVARLQERIRGMDEELRDFDKCEEQQISIKKLEIVRSDEEIMSGIAPPKE